MMVDLNWETLAHTIFSTLKHVWLTNAFPYMLYTDINKLSTVIFTEQYQQQSAIYIYIGWIIFIEWVWGLKCIQHKMTCSCVK